MSTDPNEEKSKIASLAFVQSLNLIYLQVSLNKDGPYSFILDTGAQATNYRFKSRETCAGGTRRHRRSGGRRRRGEIGRAHV